MKTKQIKKLLAGLIDNFCETITDDSIKTIIKEKTFISGGSIPSMIIDEFVNDFDFYFINREDAEAVKKYFIDTKKAREAEEKFYVKLITDNAVNLSDKVQLITKFTGSPEEVTKNFDWQHIKSYYIYPDKLVIPEDTYRLLVEKELIYTGSAYPLSSLMRLKKYIKKGWNVSNITILQIAFEFHQAMIRSEKIRKIKDMRNAIEEGEDISERILNEISPEDFPTPTKEEIIEEENFEETIPDEKLSVEDIIYHINGLDPLLIQNKLVKETGKYLTIEQIINLIEG